MKIILFTPLASIWSDDLKELSSKLDSQIIYMGDLLRSEIKSGSEIGSNIKDALEQGEILSPGLTSQLLIEKFFNDSSNKILVNYPRNNDRAINLADHLISNNLSLSAVLVVDFDQEELKSKLLNQFHCKHDLAHPKLETSELNPICSVCNKQLVSSYDLASSNLDLTIESYFKEGSGDLASAKTLNKKLGAKYISFTSPDTIKNLLCAGIN